MQPIRITKWISHKNEEAEPFQPFQMNIYLSNASWKDLSWLHFGNEPRAQKRQHVKDQHCHILFSVAF